MTESEYITATNLARVRAASAVLAEMVPQPATTIDRRLVSIRHQLTQIEDELRRRILIDTADPAADDKVTPGQGDKE